MKKALYLIIELNDDSYSVLQKIKERGFNATIISTESLRHALEYLPEEQHFYTLRHHEQKELITSATCIFVLDEEKLEELKQIIRETTNNFLDLKGFMYSKDLKDYEGSI